MCLDTQLWYSMHSADDADTDVVVSHYINQIGIIVGCITSGHLHNLCHAETWMHHAVKHTDILALTTTSPRPSERQHSYDSIQQISPTAKKTLWDVYQNTTQSSNHITRTHPRLFSEMCSRSKLIWCSWRHLLARGVFCIHAPSRPHSQSKKHNTNIASTNITCHISQNPGW